MKLLLFLLNLDKDPALKGKVLFRVPEDDLKDAPFPSGIELVTCYVLVMLCSRMSNIQALIYPSPYIVDA